MADFASASNALMRLSSAWDGLSLPLHAPPNRASRNATQTSSRCGVRFTGVRHHLSPRDSRHRTATRRCGHGNRQRRDADGIALPAALAEHGVDLDRAKEAGRRLGNAAAYLELHIEQGPVLESMGLPLGAVIGTFGVERHLVTWRGQAAHAGSTPMDQRRDALAGAAKLALELRPIAARAGDGAVCTSGGVVTRPGIVTSVVETAEQLLDQRHMDAEKLARMLADAQSASERFAAEEDIEVSWERIWHIQPIQFHDELVALAEEAVTEVAGESHRLPSGPLHDAAEVARAGIPTVMLFVQSLRGLSHTKLEDTKPEHLELAVEALDSLASKATAWVAAR